MTITLTEFFFSYAKDDVKDALLLFNGCVHCIFGHYGITTLGLAGDFWTRSKEDRPLSCLHPFPYTQVQEEYLGESRDWLCSGTQRPSLTLQPENLIIVGDWFLVESFTPTDEGYRHTTITSHAPTALKRIEEFDRRFSNCKWLSPEKAIRRLEKSFRPIR